MSKNTKTLVCSILAIILVAGTMVGVFAEAAASKITPTADVTAVIDETTTVKTVEITTATASEEASEAASEETSEVASEVASEEASEAESEVASEVASEVVIETTTFADEKEETTKPATTDYLLGDVDLNGKIEAADARLALRYSAHLETLTPVQVRLADVIVDGSVFAHDARLILRRSANLVPQSALGLAPVETSSAAA